MEEVKLFATYYEKGEFKEAKEIKNKIKLKFLQLSIKIREINYRKQYKQDDLILIKNLADKKQKINDELQLIEHIENNCVNITCSCGKVVSKNYFKKHLKTEIHKAYEFNKLHSEFLELKNKLKENNL